MQAAVGCRWGPQAAGSSNLANVRATPLCWSPRRPGDAIRLVDRFTQSGEIERGRLAAGRALSRVAIRVTEGRPHVIVS
jgi:hypothetical protein